MTPKTSKNPTPSFQHVTTHHPPPNHRRSDGLVKLGDFGVAKAAVEQWKECEFMYFIGDDTTQVYGDFSKSW